MRRCFGLKIHVEVWLAAASLHEAGAVPFTLTRLRQEILRLFQDLRPGVEIYIRYNANGSAKKQIESSYNYIVATGAGQYRLAHPSDPVYPGRAGLPCWPGRSEVEPPYRALWERWVAWQQAHAPRQEAAAAQQGEAAPAASELEGAAHGMHTRFSSYREAMMEHLLIGEFMRHLWLRQQILEVCKPQVDGAGYDLILQAQGVLRHVQLKTSFEGAATREVSVHTELARRQNGCVIWTRFDPGSLAPVEFWWFGGAPGAPFPDLGSFQVARHARANAQGIKAERPTHRRVPQSQFLRVGSVSELISLLFDAPEEAAASPARQLAAYLRSLSDFQLERSPAGGYDHIGATLMEAILHRESDYRSVVVPRVATVRKEHPEARTSTALLELLQERPPEQLLHFGQERLAQLLGLARFFVAERVEEEAELRQWLDNQVNRRMLQAFPGVGPKAVDYLQILVGGDPAGDDRHLAEMLGLAEIKVEPYEARTRVMVEAAALLGVEQAVLDYSIWHYLSAQKTS